MTKDDIKVWARHQHDQKVEPSMESLLKWMEDEMSARLRSGATIRKVRSSVHATVRSQKSTRSKAPCYVCNATHYIDEFPKFLAMSIDERWKMVKGKWQQKILSSYLKETAIQYMEVYYRIFISALFGEIF